MELQTPIDVQRILDRKRKGAEYDKQLKLKRKIDSESLTTIDAEYVYTSVCKTCPWSEASTIRQKLYLLVMRHNRNMELRA
jgi:hypothetical protein